MGKKYHFDLPRPLAEKLDAYIEAQKSFTSEVLRNIIIKFLNSLNPQQEPIQVAPLEQARANNPFLGEMYKCSEGEVTAKVRDLICVTEPDLKCRNENCQRYIRKRLGL